MQKLFANRKAMCAAMTISAGPSWALWARPSNAGISQRDVPGPTVAPSPVPCTPTFAAGQRIRALAQALGEDKGGGGRQIQQTPRPPHRFSVC